MATTSSLGSLNATMNSIAEKLEKLIPGVSVGIGHVAASPSGHSAAFVVHVDREEFIILAPLLADQTEVLQVLADITGQPAHDYTEQSAKLSVPVDEIKKWTPIGAASMLGCYDISGEE